MTANPKWHTFVGRCIYCDATEYLSREHIVPEGLGGRLNPNGRHTAAVLQNASCESCRIKTQALEQKCLREGLPFARMALNLDRKSRRLDFYKLKVKTIDGKIEERLLKREEIPFSLMMPSYGKPSIIYGAEVDGLSIFSIVGLGGKLSENLAVVLPDGSEVIAPQVPKRYNFDLVNLIARMLAKIALGWAVLHFGIDGFHPLIRGFILGNDEPFSKWLMGSTGPDKDGWLGRIPITEKKPETLHALSIRFYPRDLKSHYVIVGVQLFAFLGGPINEVVVGWMDDSSLGVKQ